MKKLFLFLTILCLVSCKKDHNNDTLAGKWKLIEIYQGYVMGGCLCWAQIPSVNADQLEFFITGRYKLTKSPLASSTGCTGKYRVLTDSSMSFTYECQSDPTQWITRKYTRSLNELIIDYQGIEGVYRYKYIRM